MGRHVEGYWVRKNNWFLRWHKTDNQIELFDLTNDLRNNNDVSAELPGVVEELHEIARKYRKDKGDDPRLAYYLEMKKEE